MKNKLRELRTAKEWSQSDLADKLDVSRQTINAIETEKYDPSLPLAFKVAHLFKMKSRTFLNWIKIKVIFKSLTVVRS
ncbi:MAG: helix-turn-helix transcriptional regulator [Limisphaerales bacterium]